jgi:hypothetical protein
VLFLGSYWQAKFSNIPLHFAEIGRLVTLFTTVSVLIEQVRSRTEHYACLRPVLILFSHLRHVVYKYSISATPSHRNSVLTSFTPHLPSIYNPKNIWQEAHIKTPTELA